MDQNSCIISGTVEWFKEKQIGQGWGSINCRVGLPKFEVKNSLGNVQKVHKPMIWLNIKTTYNDSGKIQPIDILDCLEEKRFIIATDARINHYETEPRDKNGERITRILLSRKSVSL